MRHMNRSRDTALFLMFLAAALPLSGQSGWTVSALGGAAVPLGAFGDDTVDDTVDDAGLATVGVTLGAELGREIGGVDGLSWVSTLTGLTFGVDDGFVTELGLDPAQIDIGRYWGATVATGLALRLGSGTPAVRLTGQLLVGAVRAPTLTATGGGASVELDPSWEPVKGLALGAIADVGERIFLTARYTTLINPEIGGEFTYLGTTTTLDEDQPMSWLRVALGVRVH